MYIYIEREIVNGGYERNDRWLRDDLVLILIWVFFLHQNCTPRGSSKQADGN